MTFTRKNLIYLIGGLLAMAVAAFAFGLQKDQPNSNGDNSPEPTTQNGNSTSTPGGTNNTSTPSTGGTNSQTGTPANNENISVYEPSQNATVSQIFVINGKARVFENTVSFRIKNLRSGKTYINSFTNAYGEMGRHGPFSFLVNLSNQSADLRNGDKIQVEVFEASARDGSDINKVTRTVNFLAASRDMISVKAFFSNPNVEQYDCSVVFDANRVIPRTAEVGRAAILELLKGLTESERQSGFTNSLPNNARLNSLRIENETAYADFNEALNQNVAGSCRVLAIRAQIEQTLKQFPTVKNVVISVNGRTADILQP